MKTILQADKALQVIPLTRIKDVPGLWVWALVPFDGSPPRAIFLDVTAVESHAPPQSNILVLRGRL